MGIYVKELLEKLKKRISKKLNDTFSEKDYVLIVERKMPWIVTKFLATTGRIYHIYKDREEKFRVTLYNFRDDFINIQILYEISMHSRKLLLLVLLTFLIPSSTYFFFYTKMSFILSQGSIESLLLAYFAGITALLGIIFAFYSVGFQIATSKFSSEVTDYINQEKVGKFFFRLLVIAGLFSLMTLIIQYGVSFPLMIPFVIATFLVTFSLLGILIFKDDYITKLKPHNIFNQIYYENLKAIKQVNEYHVPKVYSFNLIRNKNIASFKLHIQTRNSWSIVMTHQKNTDRRLKIHESLFRDLIREGSIDDASYGIRALGHFLVNYIEIKHFIDTDKPWWFPSYQELVSADNISMFPLKANYEAQGIGRLGISKSLITWLEDKIINQLETIQNDLELMKYPKIQNALIYAYETILAGRFEKTNLGLQKTLRGTYELQEFELTERVCKLFFALGGKINDESVKGEYINTLGQIKTTIADGFYLRTFPGRLDDWKNTFKSNITMLFKGEKTIKDVSSIIQMKLPKYFHEILIDYLNRMKVEEFAEGKLITPESWLVNELIKIAENKEKEMREKFLYSFLDEIFKLWEQPLENSIKNSFNLIIFGLFNQLISAKEWDFLEKIITKYKQKLFKLIVQVDSDNFIELELREPIEFGVFNGLVARNKAIFDFYNRIFFLTQLHLGTKIDRTNPTEVLKLARRPMMLGALAYLISELDEDFHYVKEVTLVAEVLFPNADLGTVFELTKDMKVGLGTSMLFQIIYEESSRYRPYYREIINSISDLPPDIITSGAPPFGMSSRQTVKHKSEFIRELASRNRFADMDECFDGYVEWLKKQEQIKKLLKILEVAKNKK
ncbi:MAG: hypothetical protein HYW62_00870 [Candidatus Levybacteria bacterium]|nr:hypothetical protein [Candidatus Levybacteria bacterium]